VKNKSIALETPFYARDTRTVALELIGKHMHSRINGKAVSGMIVETEAYLGTDDPASHACRKKTPRNAVMFGPPGVSYVYFVYGNHHCVNVVTEQDGMAGAVLIRAVEPRQGMDVMAKRRKKENQRLLTNGPGKVAQAFGLTKKHSGMTLSGCSSFWISEEKERATCDIDVTPRIGIREGTDLLYRYSLKGNPWVSG